VNWKKTKAILEKITGRGFGESSIEADLSEANLRWANLSEANLFKANLSGANLFKADLSGANLSKADLRWANLSGANLSGTGLSKANLSGANLFGADLSKADLSKADLRWANLSGAKLFGTGIFAFTAGCHFAFYVPWQRHLRIGCIDQSLYWWLANYEKMGKQNNYTDAEIARYGAIIKLINELYPAETGEEGWRREEF
jgi:hypothetical protein